MSVQGRIEEKLENKIAILYKALEFYANEENWEAREVRGCCEDHNDYLEPETDKDLGARAREALKEINDLPLW